MGGLFFYYFSQVRKWSLIHPFIRKFPGNSSILLIITPYSSSFQIIGWKFPKLELLAPLG